MFTFVISLIVVGAALFFASRIAMDAAPKPDKPATPVAESVVGRHATREPREPAPRASDPHWLPTADVERIPVLRRVRSAFVLMVILTVLGAFAALLLVVGGAVLLSALRSAVQ